MVVQWNLTSTKKSERATGLKKLKGKPFGNGANVI